MSVGVAHFLRNSKRGGSQLGRSDRTIPLTGAVCDRINPKATPIQKCLLGNGN
ncbi:hypothetical protein [Oxynema aestuarii]|uniref:Uncharacterized protein n=1 Tax=Oxynema aestuarii AP17 TaxID=2064643 RepID=A0A6H1TS88_9CYAN|nr:hypothetical protein [Oxynema aestuarii]QIZ69462.1 hypothetical protein HCG48_01725 [Oxynema aestuarii AP17]